MNELIKVIAFDADDTLWSNEPFFQEVEKQYTHLLKSYGTPKEISAALFQTEMNNLQILGYGAKAFTLSMVETALQISNREIATDIIQEIVDLGKSLLKMPIELLPGVKETLKALKETGKYKLVVATKGDLLDQENKLERSGLSPYFDHIEVMSDKTEKEYLRLLNILQIAPSELLMVGNSFKSDIQPVLSLGGYGVHIPFEVMLSLIDETAKKVHELSPAKAQTGPAIRYDENVINRHLDLLADVPDMQELYEKISKSIYKQK